MAADNLRDEIHEIITWYGQITRQEGLENACGQNEWGRRTMRSQLIREEDVEQPHAGRGMGVWNMIINGCARDAGLNAGVVEQWSGKFMFRALP